MKRILTVLLPVLAVLLTASCQKTETVADAVTVKTDEQVVPAEGGVISIAINSTVAWTAKASESWVTLSPTSGEAGDATVKASVLKNDTNDSRTATVTFTAGTKTATYTILQSQLDAMNIATTDFTVEAAGGTVEIPVSSNIEYTVTVPEAVDWIKVVSTRGMVDTKITLSVDPTQIYATDENGVPTFDENAIVRTAKVTVMGAGPEKQVTIGQKSFIPVFEYQGDWAGLQWSFYDGVPVIFPQEGGTFVINVNTNIDWRAYFSVYDATIDAGVDVMENGWAKLSFDTQANTITIEMEPNDSYFTREDYLYTVGLFDGVEDGNFGGLGWFQQAGKSLEGAAAEFIWSKTLAEMGIPEGYNRLAYSASGALLVSDGEKVHAVSPADGTYWKALSWPGITPTSIDVDDAGHVIIASDVTADMDWNTYELLSGTELKVYYATDVNETPKEIILPNALYGTVGGFRARGDLATKGAITGVAGGASYWFGYDIADFKAVSNYYGTQNSGPGAGPNTFWTPETAAAVSVGPDLHDGVLFRGYDGAESLYYRKDAYTPSWAVGDAYEPWTLLTNAGAGGNENQNNMDIIDYKGKRIVAYTQGFHFDYSSNATIYVLDVTDITDVKPLVTINPQEDIEMTSAFTGANSADVLLHATDDALELYVVNSGRSLIGKYKIVF